MICVVILFKVLGLGLFVVIFVSDINNFVGINILFIRICWLSKFYVVVDC